MIFADFALQWQPVPENILFRPQLAIGNGIALILSATALLIPKWRMIGAMSLTAMLAVWVVVLHAPRLVGHWTDIVVWLGVAEAAAMLGGALLLLGYARGSIDRDGDRFFGRLGKAGRLMIGISLPIFGLSHFAYAEFTAGMVPSWIPAKLFWAYFTGCAHIAAGVAVLSGLWAPLASRLLAVMFGSWVLILHAPRVAADPSNRAEWTMLFIAMALTASACLLAAIWNSERLLRPRSGGK
ncbi:MAG: hypothetical protein WA793_10125 [Sphingorhabdus sp.]|uniref:hypothetical protein n=1 Tax=Sphingorhabdus sp. TaxID=1902408 RepID=UPI003C9FB473